LFETHDVWRTIELVVTLVVALVVLTVKNP
jgi:hypothetical protein